jgi:hypothetical protein
MAERLTEPAPHHGGEAHNPEAGPNRFSWPSHYVEIPENSKSDIP